MEAYEYVGVWLFAITVILAVYGGFRAADEIGDWLRNRRAQQEELRQWREERRQRSSSKAS